MSFNLVSPHLPEDVRALILNKPADQWINSLDSPRGTKCLHLFEVIVSKNLCASNQELLAIAQQAKAKLAEKKIKKAFKGQYQTTCQQFDRFLQTQKKDTAPQAANNNAPIQIAKVSSKSPSQVTTKLEKITKGWRREAEQREYQAVRSHLPADKKDIAEDSRIISDCLHYQFKRRERNSKDYLAFAPTTKKVEGIATVIRNKKKNTVELKFIGTRPTNVALFPTDHPTRGAGTALLTKIFKDWEKSKKLRNQNLILEALPSAVPFYKNVGFVDTGRRDRELVWMKISPAKRDAFLQSHQGVGSTGNLPDAKELK